MLAPLDDNDDDEEEDLFIYLFYFIVHFINLFYIFFPGSLKKSINNGGN